MNVEHSQSRGVQLALLESELMNGTLPRPMFLSPTAALGVPLGVASNDADRFRAIAVNQAQRRARLEPSYDYTSSGPVPPARR